MSLFDVAVLGSGFASSLCATILSKQGMRVLMVDRGVHPRFSIGESSTPVADYLLHHLATRYEISELIPLTRYGSWRETYPNIRCGCKRGFSYVWHGNGDDYQADSEHGCELLVTANASEAVADTQWYRPDVDQFFFQIAQRYGVETWESTQIEGIDQTSTGRWQLHVNRGNLKQLAEALFLVDGSGPDSLLLKREKVPDRTAWLQTNTSAIYSHFELESEKTTEDWLRNKGAKLEDFPYPIDQAAVHHVFRKGWLWQIGFVGKLSSLGFVSKGARHSSSPTLDSNPKNAWHQLMDNTRLGEIYRRAALAKTPGRLFSVPRIQRLREYAAGNRWVALPFTAGFIDPLHSTGIAHSLSGVERICDALLACDAYRTDLEISRYSKELIEEFQHIDRLISACYLGLNNFRLFSACTMLYFAAVTTYERQHREGTTGQFLLADDQQLRSIAIDCHRDLNNLLMRQPQVEDDSCLRFVANLEASIESYNHVGLFRPPKPNMYWHTAAK